MHTMTTSFAPSSHRISSASHLRREVLPLPQESVRNTWGLGNVEHSVLLPPEQKEWGESNTRGRGRAIAPTRANVRRGQRIVAPTLNSFDKTSESFIDRWARVSERIIQSKGGVSLAVAGIVLTLGLSPLVLEEEVAPAPSAESSAAVDTASVGDSTQLR